MGETHYAICNLCDAICGLEIETAGRKILAIRGDRDDPFSRGHVCPKGTAHQDVYDDPDRLRRPVRRIGAGWEELSWDCLLYTSDAADERSSVDLGGRRI